MGHVKSSLINLDNLQIKDECGIGWNDSISSSSLTIPHVRRQSERHSLTQAHLSNTSLKTRDNLQQ